MKNLNAIDIFKSYIFIFIFLLRGMDDSCNNYGQL